MKRLSGILFLLAIAFGSANAQLITDSKSKLKTEDSDRQSFVSRLFRSKKMNTSDKVNAGNTKKVTPRYSKAASPVGRKSAAPRYSNLAGKSAKQKKVTPKYSGGNPFTGSQYKIQPKYSKGSPFKGSEYKIKPKYSSGNPFRGSDYKIEPKYSKGSPFRGSDYKIEPRYSKGSPFRGADYKIEPRYTQGNPFRGSDYKIEPRYSQGSPFKASDYKIEPRYSEGNPFRGADYKVQPRYSAGSPFQGMKYRIKPRYTGTNKLFLTGKERQDMRYYNEMTVNYRGDMKVRKGKRPGDQHPGSNYTSSIKYKSPLIRDSLRKWNVYWVRLNAGNKLTPKGVKKEPKKPKFDKKERVIWNN